MPDVPTSQGRRVCRPGRRRRLWIGGVLASLALAPPAFAQPAPDLSGDETTVAQIEGTVLAIQGEEIVVDLGSSRGASAGEVVELWRPVKVKHPVTGRVLTDRFRIGSIELVQVQKTLTLARASGTLARPAEPGDAVVLTTRVAAPRPKPALAPRAPAPSSQPPTANCPPAQEKAVPEDADAHAVTQLFEALHGVDPAARAERYERYARENPESRFAGVLLEEAGSLRELLGHRLVAQKRDGAAPPPSRPEARNFAAPEKLAAGSPARFAVELEGGATGAVIHLRKSGNESYASVPMRAIGGGYYAADIPGDRLTAGTLHYFIEATSASGKAIAVVGDAGAPREVEVADAPRPHAPPRPPMRIDLLSDFADYNRMRGNDHVLQTEGSFGVRLGDAGIRAVRLGFGVYRGVGGSIDDLDKRMLDPRHVGLTYGYLETEIGIVSAFSFLLRGSVGLLDSGISGGGQAGIRIGSDLKTNIVLGAELLGGVGARGYAQLELASFERFPILLRTEVTNQPAGTTPAEAAATTSGSAGQVGGRGIVQIGYKILPELVVAVRGSFQGRTIQHAGPGFGGAVSFVW